ncbi:hypothetical protein TRFO_36578 [Tritrichomonas foetus]|uniref:Condensation domain-containing protein n=1 Tax=Tritrichomonas foetus TaxID=1144522 RepID=A0A1J4JHZ0_9EUKA|nr:hypothetical protein TRFO_36578 [Tritrichomonas foetus]|eukprot:OHS97227.1 hypothetical protein TRFO_36578 [Tritrichomonas foetus]
MISIPCSKGYKFEIEANTAIQLSFEVDDPKYVDQIIKNLKKRVIGLYLHTDDDNNRVIFTENEPPIIKLDDKGDITNTTINFAHNNVLDHRERFAKIGYNDKYVILNVSHAVSDGGYFKQIVNHILSNEREETARIESYFPHEVEEIFYERLKNAPNDVLFWESNPFVNRVKTNDRNKLFSSKEVKYCSMTIPAKKLRSYNILNGRLNRFTESMWLSLFVSHIVSFKNSVNGIPSKICIPTCTDFRQYLNTRPSYSVCSCYSTVFPCADVSPNKSLSEIGKMMKNDLKRRMDRGEDFGFIKTINNLENSTAESYDGVGLELTYVGQYNIKKPIKDVFCNLAMDGSMTDKILSLMGFSVVDKASGRNDVTLRLRYVPSTLHQEEVSKMAKSVEYFLKEIPLNISVNEAVKAIEEFQKKL